MGTKRLWRKSFDAFRRKKLFLMKFNIFSLIGRLHDLDRLNNSHIQLFLEVDPQCVEPLLIEIFDLKPPSGAGIKSIYKIKSIRLI